MAPEKKKKNYSAAELKEMDRHDLECLAIQLSAYNNQLQALLKRSLESQDGKNKKQPKQRPFDFSKYQTRHILLRFAYLGWDYQGFAVQEHTTNTIEHALFEALVKTKLVRERQSSNYNRCGRTDKGVSAFSQVVSLTVRSKSLSSQQDLPDVKDELNYPEILNRVLPKEIRVIAWSPVPSDFSSRFDCLSRTYKYFFPKGCLDTKKMQEAASYMIGNHDFRNLCKMDVGNGVVNFIRTVDLIDIESFDSSLAPKSSNSGEEYYESEQIECESHPTGMAKDNLPVNTREKAVHHITLCRTDNPGMESIEKTSDRDGYSMFVVTVKSRGFLWHQIRAIMAVLVLIGEGKEEPTVVQELLDVEAHPCKPQYSLASEVPLNLFSTEYDESIVRWHYSEDTVSKVCKDLQLLWAQHNIRSTMIRSMLHHLRALPCTRNSDAQYQHLCLTDTPHANQYKPLMQRQTCGSLEEKVGHYVKRRRLDANILDSVRNSPGLPATSSAENKTD